MTAYLRIVEEEGGKSVDLPLETDSTLLLSTLQSAFPKSCGLMFRTENNSTRVVRMSEGRFYPPKDRWGDREFISLKHQKKRKADEVSNGDVQKKRVAISDLIILGLAWKTTEDQVRRYFETFGEVTMAIVKTDSVTGMSKGFGFVRFRDPLVQTTVISRRHFIDGRWCDVKIPNNHVPDRSQDCKIFVGQLTPDLSAVQLREYFSSFGEVADIFIPQPFRMFAFVTFNRSEDAKSVCERKDHEINGVPVNVSEAMPLTKHIKSQDKTLRSPCATPDSLPFNIFNIPFFNTWNPIDCAPYFWNGMFTNNSISG